jgi:hypothetical protein
MKKLILLFVIIGLSLPGHARPVTPIQNTTADRNALGKPLAPFAVPLGTFNVALGKPVTSSDDAPIIGELPLITNGDKEANEKGWVELGPGMQWVQIDLKMQARIFGIHIWHYYGESRVYRDVVVQVSDDPTFSKAVRTVFNNDQNNSSNLGKGTDKEYFEYYQGFRIDTRGKNYEGVSGRYVRLYSKGNSSDPVNHYIEVEVIGKPLSAVPLKDIEARRSRGEVKASGYAMPEFYWKWPGIPAQMAESSYKKITVPRPAEFLLPVDATNIRDDASMSLVVPAKRRISGNWWMQLDFGSPREIYAIVFANTRDSDTVAYDLTVQSADDNAFTKNVRTLFKSRENRAERSKYEDGPYGGLLIDLRDSEIRGLSTRYLRFIRSSYYLKLDVCINASIIGKAKPTGPVGQPGLMFWQTEFPPRIYW